jgi:hypothetical protein
MLFIAIGLLAFERHRRYCASDGVAADAMQRVRRSQRPFIRRA